MSTADRRRPFAENAEAAVLPRSGDANSEPAARTAHNPSCRCRGTGTMSGFYPLNGAVLLVNEACPWCADLAEQQLAEAAEAAREALAASRAYEAPTGVEP